MVKNLTCINCPIGCYLTVELEGDKVLSVQGNQCKRGEVYANTECLNPTRTMTSTVRLHGASVACAPVKSAQPLPKALVKECARALNGIDLRAPVRIGDIALANVCGTGTDIIVTRNIPAV